MPDIVIERLADQDLLLMVTNPQTDLNLSTKQTNLQTVRRFLALGQKYQACHLHGSEPQGNILNLGLLLQLPVHLHVALTGELHSGGP